MSAGTITLTNNSDAVAGAGTAFLTDLAAGDFIVANVGGIAYTLPVKAVASATALTIVNKFSGPTMSGLAWFVITRDQQAMVTAALVAQNTEALRVLNLDKSNWQAVFSAAGDITVTLPDNTQFTGPSWQKIVTLLAQSDIEAIQPLAEQVREDAQQVASDRVAVEDAATSAFQSASSAGQSASAATGAAETSTSAAVAAVDAKSAAEAAQAAAEQAASNIDPTQYLRTDDPAAGRNALEVYSRDEVDEAIQNGGAGIPIGFQYNHSNRAQLNAGTTPGDGQVVTIAGSFSDLADYAEANEPLTDNATWLADPTKRGCYVVDRTAGTMRLPDLNGVQPGSFGPIYKSGDGGNVASGTMSQNAAPDATGNFGGFYGEATYVDLRSTGVFARSTGASDMTKAGISTTWNGLGASFALSRGHAAYGRNGATRVKPDTMHGVWVIQYANAAQNSGEIDALGIDTDLQQFKSTQLAKNAQIEGRIGYALVTTTTNTALNTRTVLSNPFGNNTPVICKPEILHAPSGKWVTAPWLWTNTSTTYGIEAAYSEGEGIVLRTPQTGFVAASPATGTTLAAAYNGQNYGTPSPIRIHVWKVTA